MSKKRDLPKYVKIDGPSYIWRKFTPQKVIGRIDKMTLNQVKAWVENELLENNRSKTDLRALANEYNRSPQFIKNKSATQKAQLKYCKTIINYPLSDGKHTLGDINYNKLTTGKIQSYLDKRFDDGVVRSANLEFAYLSAMFTWACSRDKMTIINPCIGVQKLKETPAQNYVSNCDFTTAHSAAIQCPSWYLAPMIQVMYVCRLRVSEVVELQFKDVLDFGLFCYRKKGSRANIIEWTPELKAAIDQGTHRDRKITTLNNLDNFVFSRPNGEPYTISAVQTAWSRLMRQIDGENGFTRFKLHDIKRKSISDDMSDDFQAGSGHLSASMGNVYDKRIKTVPGVVLGARDSVENVYKLIPKKSPKTSASD